MSLSDMGQSVAIIGGGIAGLSAAHELVKRGFDVHVYERRPLFGGKAASYRVPAPKKRKARKDDLPGEHGFRFFPGWYRHLFETMSEIPYQKKRTLYQGATVADNLVHVKTNRLAWTGRTPVDLPLQVPRSPTEALAAGQFLTEFRQLGLSAGEVALFFSKLFEVAALTEAARVEKLEKISWWEFLECDDPARSQAYRDFIRATTRTMVAAKAEQASAYTIGRVAVRTFLDTLTSVDRVLNGPTNETWIDPWVKHLEAQGVVFHPEMELDSIQFDAKKKRVRQLQVQPVVVSDARRLRTLIARTTRNQADLTQKKDEDLEGARSLIGELSDLERFKDVLTDEVANELALALERAREKLLALKGYLGKARKELKKMQEDLAQASAKRPAASSDREKLRQNLKKQRDEIEKLKEAATDERRDLFGKKLKPLCDLLAATEALGRRQLSVAADFFVLALPLEQLAYHVNRSEMLTFFAPELRNVLRLSRHMDWMAGIQFYLNAHVSFSPGHLVGMNSPWALTAIESTAFWKDVSLPSDVKSILSVDISAWDQLGIRTRKEAFNCTNQEIAEEVWEQLERMLNRDERPDVLRRDMLVGGDLVQNQSYHLDESIVDLRDRKKQAFYERARGVRFNTLDLVREGEKPDADLPEDQYMWGARLRFNVEPLLINRPGSHQLRPGATTKVDNLFLAGDYIKTETDLATMEGANESARLAVNAILDVAGSRKPRCEIYPFSPARQVAGAVATFRGALGAFESVATNAATGLQQRFWKPLALGMMRAKANRQIP